MNDNFFKLNPFENTLSFIYSKILLKLFTRKTIEKKSRLNVRLKEKEVLLKKADLKILPVEYYGTIFFIFLFLLIILNITAIILFFFISLNIFLAIITLGNLFIFVLQFFFTIYPHTLISERQKKIDATFPLILPYLKVLTKELTISKTIDILKDFIVFDEIRSEFEKLYYYKTFLGLDINTAIKELIKYTPSKNLAEFLSDISAISVSGGNIYKFVSRKYEVEKVNIKTEDKKYLETNLIISEIYILLLLIAPLFYAIIVSLFGLISSFSFDSLDTNALQNTEIADENLTNDNTAVFSKLYLLLGLLPFGYFLFFFIVYSSQPLIYKLPKSFKGKKAK